MYERKIAQMLDYLVCSSDFLEVETHGEIRINMPEYINSEDKHNIREHFRYLGETNGRIDRIRFRFEKMGNTKAETINEYAVFDELGIELQRDQTIETNSVEKRKKYVRLDGKPHIVEETDELTGEVRYFDIKDSQHFEDLDIDQAQEIKQEEIKDLTPVQKIRIAERTSYSVYGEGIKKILGFEQKLDQINSDIQR